MLHPIRTLVLSTSLAIALLLQATSSSAQVNADSIRGAPLSAEEQAKFENLAKELQESANAAAKDPGLRQQVGQMARHVDTIANAAMAAERDKVLRFLGINPDSEHAAFIFVSWSMPLDILRSYAIESMWTGSTLVFRGVPPGRKIVDFFTKDLRQLVWGKGAAANISVDPRLFEAYGVKSVPTIVLTRTRDNFSCFGAGEKKVKAANGREATYNLCPEISSDKYIKVSGAVTMDWALETFRSNGFPEAGVYLSALRKGYQTGQVASQTQQPFKGEWDDALSPAAIMRQKKEAEAARSSQGR